MNNSFLGEVAGLFVTPGGIPPDNGWPGIIVLTGHSMTSTDFMTGPESSQYGWVYPANGYALFVINSRAMCGGEEDTVAKAALLDGFYFGGIQYAESVLAAEFFRRHPLVEAISFSGHSGGSTPVNIGKWLKYFPFASYIADSGSGFFNHGEFGEDFSIMASTHPLLCPYNIWVDSGEIDQQQYSPPYIKTIEDINLIIDFLNSL